MIGSFGVALSQNLRDLAITHSIQGFGTSCFLSAGAATVSDIFKLEERGRAMGVYSSVSNPINIQH
jgi:MFS family permease